MPKIYLDLQKLQLVISIETMEKICRKYLHTQIPSLLFTPLSIFLFLHDLAFAMSPYNPPEQIFLGCGLSDSTINTLDGRTWIGDVNSEYSPLEPKINGSTVSKAPQEPPYSTSRLSHSQFTYRFTVTAGQKFIRLYFYPTYHNGFNSSRDIFSVNAGSFTLLSNFSASDTADAFGKATFSKEFCINVEEDQRILNIKFSPSTEYKDSYAFISGIEIVSMPPSLYYTAADDPGFRFVDQGIQYSIRNSNALETLYRINVGRKFISPSDDTGMYRTWVLDNDYVTDARPSDLPVNTSINLSFSRISNYSAPTDVYRSARTMGNDSKINENYSLTWEFEVDSGFTYFLRLHFCEFQTEVTQIGDRVFRIYLANQTAETQADVIAWSGGNGVPIYKDYAVMIGSKGNEKKQNLSIKLNPAPRWRTKYSDAILNGVEIFKVDNSGNLAVPNTDLLKLSPPSVAETPSSPSKKSKKKRETIIAMVGGLVSFFVIISLLFLFWRPFSTSKTKSRKFHGSILISELCTHFSLSEIKVATNNFHNDLIIGVGGFGNVYKGFINGGATPVAIKRLNPGSQQGALEFQTEIGMLSQLVHIHLVSLIGYCNDNREMILVYDFMARGTVRDHLYNSDNPPLPWNQRLQICIGAARGLQYLHTEAKHVIIHRDVKTTNILLDEKWVAKVSDFGLSRFGPNSMSKTHVSTVVKGSIGYLDPEYYQLQQLTVKSDVYSFGVVLLEVLCGRPPILQTEERNKVSLAVLALQRYGNGTIDEIVDPFLKGKIKSECLNKFAEVAISCLNADGRGRPSMSDVVRGIELAFELQESAEENHDHIESCNEETATSKNYETDDSAALFSSVGEHILELKSVSMVTITTGDDEQSTFTESYDSRFLSGAVFSEIMNPQGR